MLLHRFFIDDRREKLLYSVGGGQGLTEMAGPYYISNGFLGLFLEVTTTSTWLLTFVHRYQWLLVVDVVLLLLSSGSSKCQVALGSSSFVGGVSGRDRTR